MNVWIVLSLMAVAATAIVILPLIGKRWATATARDDHDRQIYLDQLDEIERETAQGLIAEDAAEAARTEIARRLLALNEEATDTGAEGGKPGLLLRVYLVIAIPAAAAGLYLMTGSPHLPGQPAADRAAMQIAGDSEARALIAQLAEKLESRPEDLRGWVLYAKGLQSLRRFDEASAAWQRAAVLAPDNAEIQSQYAEALIFAANGSVTEEARKILARTLSLDSAEPRARYYAGLAASQNGDLKRALSIWIELSTDSPADAPWSKLLKERISRLAAQAGVKDEQLAQMRTDAGQNTAPRGPTREDVEAAQSMSPEDRMEMIRGMVGRLAARMAENPDDAAGWVRLARSYSVLEEHEKSREAWKKAAALRPDDVETLSSYAAAIAKTTPDVAPPPDALALISEKILAIEPDNGGALWFSGMALAAKGDAAGARQRWQHLLGLLDPASAEYKRLKSRLDALPTSPPQ